MAGSATLLDHSASTAPIANQKILGGGGGGGGGGKRPMLHIDDIVSVAVDIDSHAPIEKVLQEAELCFSRSTSSRSFGRPDLALKDYIRANMILLDMERNKDWPALQRLNNKGQLERYQRLGRQLKAAERDFEAIKAEIKADNAKTGIQPVSLRPSLNGQPEKHANHNHLATNTPQDNSQLVNGGATTDATHNRAHAPQIPEISPSPPAKVKPVIQPKPQNLHGKTLHPTGAGAPAKHAVQDLAQRFANLRSSTANRVQDPRIRTQPIPSLAIPSHPDPDRPSQYEPPKPLSAGVPFPSAFAEMPRVPAAIYNPARGTVSNEAAELPSSAPRAIFTRTNSIKSFSPTTKPTSSPVMDMSARAQAHVLKSGAAKRTKLTIPPGDTISVDSLRKYMKAGAKDVSILLIDIRTREDFDEGHILSQATICVESEILMRENISAEQIQDSMVLAPPEEHLLFERRHEFDLVVFYDQDSKTLPRLPETDEERAVVGLYDALSQYDFAGGLEKKQNPKLLEGGLEAWTNVLGSGSLQTSSTSASSGSRRKTPMAQAIARRRRPTYVRPIQDPEEAKRWKDAIADPGAISPIRTTEDFLRRFPAVSPIQESMVSPLSPISSPPSSPFPVRLSHDESMYTALPSPPTRPPPTVPRRSHSGLAETDSSTSTLPKRSSLKAGVDHPRQVRTGLVNTGVLCFANSSLQSIFATPGFAHDLSSGNWLSSYKVPRKPDEHIDNPQLLTRCLANLFHWLDQGLSQALEAKTLMSYIYHIHSKYSNGKKKPPAEVFGGPSQQDAQEFYSFLMDNIHDETNIHRDRKPSKALAKDYTPRDGTVIQNAMTYWREYSTASSSIVDKYFRGLEVFISTCQNRSCGKVIHLFQPTDVWILNLAGLTDHHSGALTLDKVLEYHQRPEFYPELSCETCKSLGRERQIRFARLPDRLAFCLNRFNERSNKIHTKVRFPIRDLDLTRYCAERDRDMSTTDDAHFAGRMRYDCYAVTVHVGQGINGGHYYNYVQDEQSRDPTDWFKCNDTIVDRVKIGTPGHAGIGDVTETMYQSGNASAYMVFYRRQGT